MKKYSQLQKIISVLISFIILTEFTGCYSTRIIPTSEFNTSDKYLIHYKNAIIPVENLDISGGMISCKPDLSKNNYSEENKIQIYLISDSLVNMTGNSISFPLDNIDRTEQKVADPKKTKTLTTVLIIAGCVGVVAGLTVLIISAFVDKTTTDASNILDACVDMGVCSDSSPE